jgi:PadR family transcriptional regulator, regulatory protein AphA
VSTIALTPTSYVVLGCLATAGPSTPYDLKQAVTGGIGYFWSFPHSQLYSEPARLARAGLLDEHREEDGRRRRTFSITDAGRRALQDWLADPTAELPDIRDGGLLKLFFGDHAGPDQISALARSQRDAHQQRLELYERLDALQAVGPAAATIGLGLAWERAAAAFWAGIAEHPPRS